MLTFSNWSRAGSTPAVLVVDDNSDALRTFADLLAALGVEDICTTGSAEHALELLAARSFTLIVCDYRLEGMDGVEFVERLRAAGDETPVILVSGAPDKAGVIRATNCQRVDFLGKPFRIPELVGSMQRFAEAA
jgi:CheY-like chemotaxis protein